MRIVIQRVKNASVTIGGKITGSIGHGLLLFLGVGGEDTKEIADIYVDKLLKLRIFADEEGKTNLSVKDVNGELLIISQFTLYADCSKGNRPSFMNAGSPEMAKQLYEYFCEECKKRMPVVETGEFGADMKIELINDGPFTVCLNEELIHK